MRNNELGDQGIPFVRGGDIGDGTINHNTGTYIKPEFEGRLTAKLTQAWDVAFITKGTVGRAGILRPEQPSVVFAPQVAYWRSLQLGRANPRFIYYLIRGPEFQANLDAVKTHGAMAADYVSITQQHDFRLTFPPIDDQRSIANILGSLDDKIELNRRMNETLEEMARAVFKSWFVDFDPVRAKAEGRQPEGMDAETAALFPSRLVESELGLIPEGWTVRPLDSIANFLNGLALQRFPAVDGEPHLPVIKIAEMRTGITNKSDKASSSIDRKYIIDNGDVLFSWSGSLVLQIWTHGRGALNQHLFKVTSDKFPKWFFFWWLMHHMPNFRAIAAAKATTMGHIQRHHLTEALVVEPPKDLLNAATTIFAPWLDKCVGNDLESRTLASLRDLLLPKLISGELRIPDAERLLSEAP